VQKVDKDTPIVDNENISQDKEPVMVNLGASVPGNDSLPKRTPSIGASLDGEKEIVINKHAYKPQNILSQELKPELAAKFDTYWCSANEMPEKTSIGYIPVKTDELANYVTLDSYGSDKMTTVVTKAELTLMKCHKNIVRGYRQYLKDQRMSNKKSEDDLKARMGHENGNAFESYGGFEIK
jgi:hypothetical protein